MSHASGMSESMSGVGGRRPPSRRASTHKKVLGAGAIENCGMHDFDQGGEEPSRKGGVRSQLQVIYQVTNFALRGGARKSVPCPAAQGLVVAGQHLRLAVLEGVPEHTEPQAVGLGEGTHEERVRGGGRSLGVDGEGLRSSVEANDAAPPVLLRHAGEVLHDGPREMAQDVVAHRRDRVEAVVRPKGDTSACDAAGEAPPAVVANVHVRHHLPALGAELECDARPRDVPRNVVKVLAHLRNEEHRAVRPVQPGKVP
mmetsp:Transcript_11714/g.32943  ORF Transcript_11714/g.32943 Transcript_11714/m.32943 type:complete len:256 (-) Transcript_11714:286-1053(-)